MCRIIFKKYYDRFKKEKECAMSFEENMRKLLVTIEQGELKETLNKLR